MKAVAPAILYALFVWWFSTGLVLMVVLRRKAERAALVGAAILFPVSLVVLAQTASQANVAGAYLAFTAAIVLWGTQEIAFLTGVLTGPRPQPCPPSAGGFDRLVYAVSAILYHEIGLVVSGAALLVVTWDKPNQVGAMTFLVLWLLRLSAKLNLFLGVPILNDEALPEQISFVRSYFRRGPVNSFLPISMFLSVLCTWNLIDAGLDPAGNPATEAGDTLVAALLGLAILEHIFMLVPLPIGRLWEWSTRGTSARTIDVHLGDPAQGKLERAVPTRP